MSRAVHQTDSSNWDEVMMGRMANQLMLRNEVVDEMRLLLVIEESDDKLRWIWLNWTEG